MLLLHPLALVLVLSILVPIIYINWFSYPSNMHKKQPPSPWRLPIIGNFHQLGLNYHRSLTNLAKKHGPVMHMHLGNVPVLIISSIDAAREILKTNEVIFSDKGNSSIIKKLAYAKSMIFSDYGEYWRQLRSLVVHHILHDKRVRSYHKVREEEVDLMINKIEERNGSIVNFSELFFSLANDVICRITFGKKYCRKDFMVMLEEFLYLIIVFNVGDYIPWLSWVDRLRGLNARTEKLSKELDVFLEGVITENLHTDREKYDKNEVANQTRNFVEILLKRQKEDASSFRYDNDTIKAIILDMFSAGTGNIFATIEWALSELLRKPQVMKKVQEEVNSVAQGRPKITEEDIEKLEYVDTVLKETMRLHTLVPLVLRASSKDVNVMGYDIKAKTRVFINTWSIGLDPMVWEEPKEFRPERFLNSPFDFKGSRFEYLPFGFGRRGCPGIQFANTLMVLALANVVYKFDLSLPHGRRMVDLDMTETFTVIVQRKNPLLLVATNRSK